MTILLQNKNYKLLRIINTRFIRINTYVSDLIYQKIFCFNIFGGHFVTALWDTCVK